MQCDAAGLKQHAQINTQHMRFARISRHCASSTLLESKHYWNIRHSNCGTERPLTVSGGFVMITAVGLVLSWRSIRIPSRTAAMDMSEPSMPW